MTRRKVIKILQILLIFVCSLCFVSMIYTDRTTGKPTIFGYRPMFVCSGSMEPTIRTYSVILSVPIDADDVEKGDIVTYRNANGTIICHRVIDITDEGYFKFKGDNNSKEDKQLVSPEQIMYKIIWY